MLQRIEIGQAGSSVPALPLSGMQRTDAIEVILVFSNKPINFLHNAREILYGLQEFIAIHHSGMQGINVFVSYNQHRFRVVQAGLHLLRSCGVLKMKCVRMADLGAKGNAQIDLIYIFHQKARIRPILLSQDLGILRRRIVLIKLCRKAIDFRDILHLQHP